jgi:tetratricopeptide (TPR) repeat protein
VFWVDASSYESIIMSLNSISSSNTAQGSVDGSVESALQWMSCLPGEWLAVFDNADNLPPEVVVKFIPPGNRGNILITSRNQFMGLRIVPFENRLEINEMEESDAITLLLKASFLDQSAEHLQAAKRIVMELGCIPLAVDHAGAYIQARRCDIDEYLDQFFLHHQTLMSDTIFTGASNYDQTVYGTWDLSFKEIEKRANGQFTIGNGQEAQAAQAAILILQICAFYHHSNISKEIFQSAAEKSRKYAIDSEVAEKLPQASTLLDYTLLDLDNNGHWDGFIFGQGMAVLLTFSLIKKEQSSETISIHPLVHSWSRERMSKFEQQRIWQMGGIILSCAIPESLTSQDYALRRLIFPHIKAHQLHGSQMGLIDQYYDDKWIKFALVIRENGDWNNAEQLECQVMDIRMKCFGKEHPSTLTSMANLAVTYSNQGKWNEAGELQVEVMNMSRKLFDAEHPDTLRSMANLAVTFWNQEKWNEAEQLQVQVMDMTKKLLGAEHLDTLTSMANLAGTYWNQGKLNEAEQLQVQVMSMSKNLLGAEHPDTLTSIANLACTYLNQGRWIEAEQLQVQVIDMSKKLLGVEHPDTLRIMANLAVTYWNQEKLNEAEQLEVQVMNMRKKLFGIEHPETLTIMANLACTYLKQGRWNEAGWLQIQVMDMRKELLGVEHPDTLRSMENIAISTYRNQGKWDEAEHLQIQVIEISKKQLGAEHPDTLRSIAHLAVTYWNQRKWNKAEQLEVQVMHMRKKLFGAEHPDTLTSMENLAVTYQNQGRLDEAEELYLEVINISRRIRA